MRASHIDQPLEGIKAIGSFVGGAVVLWIVYSVADLLLVDAGNKAPGGYGGAVANQWLTTGLDVLLPALLLLLIFFGLVAGGVVARRYPR